MPDFGTSFDRPYDGLGAIVQPGEPGYSGDPRVSTRRRIDEAGRAVIDYLVDTPGYNSAANSINPDTTLNNLSPAPAK